jgi:hypothetical protein
MRGWNVVDRRVPRNAALRAHDIVFGHCDARVPAFPAGVAHSLRGFPLVGRCLAQPPSWRAPFGMTDAWCSGWRTDGAIGGWRFGNTINGCQCDYVVVPKRSGSTRSSRRTSSSRTSATAS